MKIDFKANVENGQLATGYDSVIEIDGQKIKGVRSFEVRAEAGAKPVEVILTMALESVKVEADTEPLYKVFLPGFSEGKTLTTESYTKLLEFIQDV